MQIETPPAEKPYEKPQGDKLISSVEQQSFFVSPDGKTNAKAELSATLESLFTAAPAKADDAIACRFPARTAWLRRTIRQGRQRICSSWYLSLRVDGTGLWL